MFYNALDMRVLKDGRYELLADLQFKYKNTLITIKRGFIWDLASIPTFLREEVGCPSEFAYESCLHDVLYGSGIFSREKCDLYWYLALRSGGWYKASVGKTKAKALHAGVRIGGSLYYAKGDTSIAKHYVEIETV